MKAPKTNTRMRWAMAGAAGVALLCGTAFAQDAAPTINARAATEPVAGNEIVGAVLALDERNIANSRVVAAAALDGLISYSLDGRRRAGTPAGETAGLGITYNFDLDGRATTLLATTDGANNQLRFFAYERGAAREVGAGPIALQFAAENVCFYRQPADGAQYIFILGDDGEVEQQLIYVNEEGRVNARPVRRINVPSTLAQCVADNVNGVVYASEEEVGIWRFNADPETDVEAVLIDSARFGRLDGEVGGLTLYDGGDGAQWLLASAADAGQIFVYNRADDDAYLGAFRLAGPRGGEPIGEPGRLYATSMALGRNFPNGALFVVDEGDANVKIASFADIGAALNLSLGAAQDPRTNPPSSRFAVVRATIDTTPVASFGDAADDPAIWAHPTDPAQSVIIATDKRAGLYVYNMSGEVLQSLPDGKMNNVDVRDGFMLGGQAATIVAASNRTDRTISLYRLDPQTRQLTNVADGPQATGLNDPYGLCMYRNPQSGRTYVFVNGDDTRKRQFELIDAGNGRVRANFVREITFGSQTEGCVADDATGTLYIGEEDVGLWRISAEPDGGTELIPVQMIADNPALRDDIEGVGIYDLGDGRGYIVASSQGNNSYAVYRREAPQDYLGSFVVVADAAANVDGISETDGLDVSSANLGPGFEHGAMVAQDGRNVMPEARQNYKYVPWTRIAEALGLEVRR